MRALTTGTGIAVALLLATATPAAARERLAVLIVDDADPALADDLTEVVIAAIAQRRDRELVGTREIRGRLSGLLPEGGLGACLDRRACMARVGATAGATRAVIGRLHPKEDGHHLELTLTDTETFETLARVSMAVPAGMDPLIAALRVGVNQLLTPEAISIERPRPLVSLAAQPREPTANAPSLVSTAATPARARPWIPYAGAGAAALAAVALSAAAVTGTIAREYPVGPTRAMAQADLEHRARYAAAANALLVAGAALSATAGAAFVWWWRSGRVH